MDKQRYVAVTGQRVWILVTMLSLCLVACESKRIELVATTDDDAADFGRSALQSAMVTLSRTPTSPQAYAAFAKRVDELMPFFNRAVRREAELRLSTLAMAPLEAGLSMTPDEQMEAFATTVWPSILEFPAEEGEDTKSYVSRLCASEFALDCNNVVPERWPAILNAKVWRALKSRIEVAYGRCIWCDEDSSFTELVKRSRDIHVKMELVARRAIEGGTPGDWPVAGSHALPLPDDLDVISFEASGLVKVNGRVVEGGDWRSHIDTIRGAKTRVGLHMRPEKLVADLLHVLSDVRTAGYREVTLVARQREFPYVAVGYVIDASARTSRELNVHNGDTLQILVQALEFRDAAQRP